MWLQYVLLIAVIWGAEASHFRGSFITWVVNKTDNNYYPANPYASTAKVGAMKFCSVSTFFILAHLQWWSDQYSHYNGAVKDSL